MELRTPPPVAVAVVQSLAETIAGISGSPGALAKADRLEITYAESETPARPDPVDGHISAPEAAATGALEAAKILGDHRHDPKSKRVTTAVVSKSKKIADIKRTIIPGRSKAASDTDPCRLSAFGGLRKALNSDGCEI
jgi:hypothetical protein